MYYSDRVYKSIRSIAFSPSLKLSEKIDQINETFLKSVKGVPEDLLADLFQQIFLESPPQKDTLEDRIEIIPDLIDLFYENLDDRRDPFKKEQWHIIGEVVSEFAMDLDESLLNYIMMRVVEHRALGGTYGEEKNSDS